MDTKYGRIFTEADVKRMLGQHDTPESAQLQIDAYAPAGTFNGEPVFVLRAQDNQALTTIEDYASNCLAVGCSSDHLENVAKAQHAFLDWQQAHPDKVKLPD